MATKQKRYRLKVSNCTIRGRGSIVYNPYNLRSGCNETDIRNNPDIPKSVKKRILGLRPGTVLTLQKQSRSSYLTIEVVASKSLKAERKRELNKILREKKDLEKQLVSLSVQEMKLRRLLGV